MGYPAVCDIVRRYHQGSEASSVVTLAPARRDRHVREDCSLSTKQETLILIQRLICEKRSEQLKMAFVL